MTTPTPWTVVTHAADHTPPAMAAEHVVRWLAAQPAVDLHTVVWTAGPRGREPYEAGALADVGAVRRRLLPLRLERLGLRRVGRGLTGRSVRRTLESVPTDGVLYLSSGFAGSVLRYLRPGTRRVLTHLHPLDRLADPPLGPADVDRLRCATDVWVATDEETKRWAVEAWRLDPAAVTVVPAPVDPTRRRSRRSGRRPGATRIGVVGGAWFGRDHTARLVDAVRRAAPELDLELVLLQAVGHPRDLVPLRHDLAGVGHDGVIDTPVGKLGPLDALDDLDALALTTPDDVAPWVAWEAAARGVPSVCFTTHRAASEVCASGGIAVPYPDVGLMARELLDVRNSQVDGRNGSDRHAALVERDIAVVGPRLVQIAEEIR